MSDLESLERRVEEVERRLDLLDMNRGEFARIRQSLRAVGSAQYVLEEDETIQDVVDNPPVALGNVCVHVEGLEDHLPVAGATVEILLNTGPTVLYSGTTDASGNYCTPPRASGVNYTVKITTTDPWGSSFFKTFGTFGWPAAGVTDTRNYGVCCYKVIFVVNDTNGDAVSGALVPTPSNGFCSNIDLSAESPAGTYTRRSRTIVALPASCTMPFTLDDWSISKDVGLCDLDDPNRRLAYCQFDGSDPITVHCGDTITKNVTMQALDPDYIPLNCGLMTCTDMQFGGPPADGTPHNGLDYRAAAKVLHATVTASAPSNLFGGLIGTPVTLNWAGAGRGSGGCDAYIWESGCLGIPTIAYDCWRVSKATGSRVDLYPVSSGVFSSCRVRLTGTQLEFFCYPLGGCLWGNPCPPEDDVYRYEMQVQNASPCYVQGQFTTYGSQYWDGTDLVNNNPATWIKLNIVDGVAYNRCHPTYLPMGPQSANVPGCSPAEHNIPIHCEVTE
jgi:hypothetical protein